MTKIIGNKLKEALWLETSELKTLFQAFLIKGDEVKIVGGAPRNHLLGKRVEDIDLATVFTPEEIISKAEKANIKYIPTGIDHGTVTLLINNTPFEMTTLRQDVKTDGRHALVKFGQDWREDAKRRDFTINALYVLSDGTLEDPLEEGLADIATQSVRFIGKAEDRIREDYLRSLRYYRFAAYYTKPPYDPKAIAATTKLRNGLRTLSAERIKSEFFKILNAPEPVDVITELYQNGILTLLLGTAPNIKALFKLLELEKQLNKKTDPALKLAVLGAWHQGDKKRLAERFRLSKNEGRQIELKLVEILEKNNLIKSLDEKTNEGNYLYNHYQYHFGKEEYITLLKLLYASGNSPLNVEELSEKIKQSENYETKELPVKGADLIKAGVEPGPELGNKIKQLTIEWLKSNRKLSKEDLLTLVKS